MIILTAEQSERHKTTIADIIAKAKAIRPLPRREVGGYKRNFSYSYETMPDGSIVQTATELTPTFNGKPYSPTGNGA